MYFVKHVFGLPKLQKISSAQLKTLFQYIVICITTKILSDLWFIQIQRQKLYLPRTSSVERLKPKIAATEFEKKSA